MGRRSTTLPPEKSKSLRVLCGDVWAISSFCICTPPCTLSSGFFLYQKPGRESCRLLVCKAECRCCGSPARFSGSLSTGMPLPCLSATHRHRLTVAVFPTTFRAGPTACRNSSGMSLPTRGPFLWFHYVISNFGSSDISSDSVLKKKTAEQLVYLNNDKQMYSYEQQFSISCVGFV